MTLFSATVRGGLKHMEPTMHAMEKLNKLFTKWEIQLLVLLSFTLQFFLFFAGSLRRHSTNGFLRLSLWLTYLGADLVAIYALGCLSRHEDTTTEMPQALVFFWTPFLLVHLGGQDTITAFAMEDNNLWLRHFLNLVVQVLLALYVFWKSIGRHSLELQVSCILVFLSGIIKYGERTWSLRCGSLDSLQSSTGYHYKKRLPDVGPLHFFVDTVITALKSMQYALGMFSARSLFNDTPLSDDTLKHPEEIIEIVRLQLGIMYEDLYTKALVLRTRTAIILRCISQVSVSFVFVLFHRSNKHGYSKHDIVITYSLFIGGFFLEICGMFVFMMSPWTWVWLKVRKFRTLSWLSWIFFNIGWPESNQRWPSSMGQYNFRSWLRLTNSNHPRTFKKGLMILVRNFFVDLIGCKKEKLFWLSKLLDMDFIHVSPVMMECIAKEVSILNDEIYSQRQYSGPRRWPNLGLLLQEMQDSLAADFGHAIVLMHTFTEVYFSKYTPDIFEQMKIFRYAPLQRKKWRDVLLQDFVDAEAGGSVPPSPKINKYAAVCWDLSNYMIYLLITYPTMLPLSFSAVATLEECQQIAVVKRMEAGLDKYAIPQSDETLAELACMWMRLLIYAAGKSRTETHAGQLSRGGELITFVWLLMAHYRLGDSQLRRIQITNTESIDSIAGVAVKDAFAIYIPREDG